MLSGSVKFVRGIRSKRIPVYSVTNLAALALFASRVDADTNAQTVRVSVTEVSDVAGVEFATGQDYDGYYGVFRFNNTAPDSGENPLKEFHLPDPVAGLFETDDKGNIVITQTAGAQYATWYSELTGKTYEFVKGWLWKG